MKKLTLIVAALLVASSGTAGAKGLQAGWTQCIGHGGYPMVTFDCTQGNNTVYEIYHTFILDTPIPGVIGVQGIVDFEFQTSPTVPPWWEMTTGGCNDGSIDMLYNKGSGCPSASTLLCGTTAEPCSGSGIGAITYSAGGPGRSRALILLARASTDPVTLTAARHFAWRLRFLIDNPGGLGPCAGCDARVVITFRQLDILDNNNQAVSITSTDAASEPEVCANNEGVFECHGFPVKSRTWGQLKALYR
jgi:hypothetical protein